MYNSFDSVSTSNRHASMEKRKGQMPVPLNLREFLNQNQMESLKQMENFGWELAFIRRPLDQPSTAVVLSGDKRYGILEEDGSINTNLSITIRH